ncbi:GM17276 [Drosophila sechellia]|uniref:GM17276 n=1 Tax=Drosophila sechellia TaxID=7238 RepID=B4I5H0_DROSE|nr:GM17276 [Drosophila sechellia]
MGRGAKGQWFKCKEDAKPHATMPTTRTERTPKDMPCNFLFCGELQLLRIRRVVYRAKERPLCRLDRQRATLFIAGSSKTELSLDSALELTLLGNYSCLSSPDPSCPNPSLPDFVPFESPSSRHSWKPVGEHICGGCAREILEVQEALGASRTTVHMLPVKR